MRMWMVNPAFMCRRHLLGEHLETHMFLGAIRKGMSLKGYLKNGLLEIDSLLERHSALVDEMERRKYRHKSPLNFGKNEIAAIANIPKILINKEHSEGELFRRCSKCRTLRLGQGEKK